MHEQVANHMRVCVAVGDGIESLRAVASSEPILSEAASRVMRSVNTFSLPEALTLVLSGFCVDQGDRGELLVASFFTWARDRVISKSLGYRPGQLCPYFSVHELFESLFSKSAFKSIANAKPSLYHSEEAAQRLFGETFQKAKMHYNHFIKAQEKCLLARKYLTLLLARGAAALGAYCQDGIDAVYPYLYDDIVLDRRNIGFILVQVKNSLKSYHHDEIFPDMDPFKCGLLDKSDLEDGKFPIPIIRLFFSLGAKTSDTPIELYTPPPNGTSRTNVKAVANSRSTYTTYDFVCSGVSEKVLRPVEESPTPGLWASLTNKSNPWSSFYSVPVPEVLRSQFPGCASDKGHWNNWVEEF